MHKKSFFVGIDSGGTKAEILISDINNKIISKKIYKAIHYSVCGKEKVSNHLAGLINKSLEENKLALKNCKGICIGLAGIRESKDKNDFQKHLSKKIGLKKIIIESDSVIGLHGAFNGEDGLILICGTGSILFGKLNNKFIRIGGWGWKIGDYGSGYEIGKYAIKNLTEEYESGIKLSSLSKAIEKKFSINKTTLLKRIYRDSFDFQNIVPLVLTYANKNDIIAKQIINKVTDELLKHLKIFFTSTRYHKKINLALSGSILENKNPLSYILTKKIKRNFKKIKLTNILYSPSEGAILLAKNKFYNN